MTDDWYTTWLGVAPGVRPPDYYALLCLPRFTSSPNAVEAAARAQMEKLDPHAMHPDRERRETANQMMNQIAKARITLCDPAKRRQYDLQLAQRLGVQPPAADDPDAMGETIVGGAPGSGLDALDAGGFGSPTHKHADELPDTLFEKQAPLQDMDGGYTSARRQAPIPFNVILLLGGMLVVLIAAIVAIVIFASGSNDGRQPTTTTTRAPITITPAPVPKAIEFRDHFDDRTRLGWQYDVRTGHADHVRIDNGRLILGSPDESPVRVDVTPRRTNNLFTRAVVTATIEPGVTLRCGIAATATLTAERLESGRHQVRVSIGNVIDDDGSRSALTLNNLDTLRIRFEPEAGTLYWYINDRPVATSPQIPPRGTPMIELSATGPPGDRCAIDQIHVSYDTD